MNVLLVITAGRTDIQLVTDEVRHEFGKNCASLHDELERRAGEWTIVDAPVKKADRTLSALPHSPFQICTTKLDAVLRYLSGQNLTLTHALVLDTRRNASAVNEDPRYAGAILERRLRERAGVVVWRATFLDGEEQMEDLKDARNAVIRGDVVFRINAAVRGAIRNSGCGRVVVASTGGMSGITTLVEEVVQLHAGSGVPVDPVEVADGARAHPPVQDRAVPRRSEPAESFRARRHALKLIEGGNFLGAWGAVRHLDDDEVERQWTRVVEWLSLFSASLPLPEDCDIAVLRHRYMAVRAAIRVEFALKSGDIPRAVHGTVAFFESALWDHLSSRLKRHPQRNRLFQANPAPTQDLIRSTGSDEDENRGLPFVLANNDNGLSWYRVFDDNVCAIRLADHYLINNNLKVLGQAISDEVRYLRNDVAHSEPTPELMVKARETMANTMLWSSTDGSDRTKCRFLTQPLVQNVLRDLGEENPEGLCENLIAAVKARLLT